MSVSRSTTTSSMPFNHAVHILAGATILSLVVAAIMGANGLPFHRPAVGTQELMPNLVTQMMQILFALFIIGVAFLVTRDRSAVDFASRTPEVAIARRETIGLLVYGLVAFVIGSRLGIGSHLHGSVFGPTHDVLPGEVLLWAAYNFLFFAVVPYLALRRRGYGHRAMGLKSENLKSDILLIIVVLLIEGVAELTTFPGLMSLSPTQLLIGMPFTLILHLLGTGIPVMIFIYALLFPRYLKLTGSAASAAVLGGLTYAGLHIFEYWTVYDSLTNAILSVIFVFLQFTYPGLIKSVLTLRTGNAWVHLWAYHAIAPHVTVDTPLIVRIFGIG